MFIIIKKGPPIKIMINSRTNGGFRAPLTHDRVGCVCLVLTFRIIDVLVIYRGSGA